MKTRWILAVAICFVALLVLVRQGGGNRFGRNSAAGGNKAATSGNDGAGSAMNSGGELSARPPKFETEQQRRERMMSNEGYRDDFKLSEQDVYLYVQARGSNSMSLVAAFESTRDKDYLKAAAEKFPNDPFVQAKALMWLEMSDEQRAKTIEDFKKSSPTNAFANFLAAREAMKRGDTQAALAELKAAQGKGYEEYFRESAQGLEEAYESVGRSEAEAKTLGMSEITLPHLAQLKILGREFIDLAEKAGANGDLKTQQEMLMVNWEIGQKLRAASGSVPIITELVGLAMQNSSLSRWPAGVDFEDRPTSDVLAGNSVARKELQTVGPIFEKWFPTAPDNEIIGYMDMLKTSGERQAFAWLKEKHPELTQAVPAPN